MDELANRNSIRDNIAYEAVIQSTFRATGHSKSKCADQNFASKFVEAEKTRVSYPLDAGQTASTFWSNLAFVGIQWNRVILTDSAAAPKSLIEADVGIGLMPPSTLVSGLREGKLCEVDVAFRKVVHPIAWSGDKRPSSARLRSDQPSRLRAPTPHRRRKAHM